jgi:hypothetical protein
MLITVTAAHGRRVHLSDHGPRKGSSWSSGQKLPLVVLEFDKPPFCLANLSSCFFLYQAADGLTGFWAGACIEPHLLLY